MSARFCSSCGAPLPAGAQFCAYCGTAVPAVSSTAGSALPSATAYAPAPPAYPNGPPPAATAGRPRSRRRLLVVIVVIVIVVVVIAAIYVYEASQPAIEVSGINVWSNDNVCNLTENPIGYYGFNGSTSASETFTLEVPNFNSSACTLEGVATNTSGFSLSGIEGLPLTISPPSLAGNFTVTITNPSSPFSGILNLVYR